MKAVKEILGVIDLMVMTVAVFVGGPILLALVGMSIMGLPDNIVFLLVFWPFLGLVSLPIFFFRRFIRNI